MDPYVSASSAEPSLAPSGTVSPLSGMGTPRASVGTTAPCDLRSLRPPPALVSARPPPAPPTQGSESGDSTVGSSDDSLVGSPLFGEPTAAIAKTAFVSHVKRTVRCSLDTAVLGLPAAGDGSAVVAAAVAAIAPAALRSASRSRSVSPPVRGPSASSSPAHIPASAPQAAPLLPFAGRVADALSIASAEASTDLSQRHGSHAALHVPVLAPRINFSAVDTSGAPLPHQGYVTLDIAASLGSHSGATPPFDSPPLRAAEPRGTPPRLTVDPPAPSATTEDTKRDAPPSSEAAPLDVKPSDSAALQLIKQIAATKRRHSEAGDVGKDGQSMEGSTVESCRDECEASGRGDRTRAPLPTTAEIAAQAEVEQRELYASFRTKLLQGRRERRKLSAATAASDAAPLAAPITSADGGLLASDVNNAKAMSEPKPTLHTGADPAAAREPQAKPPRGAPTAPQDPLHAIARLLGAHGGTGSSKGRRGSVLSDGMSVGTRGTASSRMSTSGLRYLDKGFREKLQSRFGAVAGGGTIATSKEIYDAVEGDAKPKGNADSAAPRETDNVKPQRRTASEIRRDAAGAAADAERGFYHSDAADRFLTALGLTDEETLLRLRAAARLRRKRRSRASRADHHDDDQDHDIHSEGSDEGHLSPGLARGSAIVGPLSPHTTSLKLQEKAAHNDAIVASPRGDTSPDQLARLAATLPRSPTNTAPIATTTSVPPKPPGAAGVPPPPQTTPPTSAGTERRSRSAGAMAGAPLRSLSVQSRQSALSVISAGRSSSVGTFGSARRMRRHLRNGQHIVEVDEPPSGLVSAIAAHSAAGSDTESALGRRSSASLGQHHHVPAPVSVRSLSNGRSVSIPIAARSVSPSGTAPPPAIEVHAAALPAKAAAKARATAEAQRAKRAKRRAASLGRTSDGSAGTAGSSAPREASTESCPGAAASGTVEVSLGSTDAAGSAQPDEVSREVSPAASAVVGDLGSPSPSKPNRPASPMSAAAIATEAPPHSALFSDPLCPLQPSPREPQDEDAKPSGGVRVEAERTPARSPEPEAVPSPVPTGLPPLSREASPRLSSDTRPRRLDRDDGPVPAVWSIADTLSPAATPRDEDDDEDDEDAAEVPPIADPEEESAGVADPPVAEERRAVDTPPAVPPQGSVQVREAAVEELDEFEQLEAQAEEEAERLSSSNDRRTPISEGQASPPRGPDPALMKMDSPPPAVRVVSLGRVTPSAPSAQRAAVATPDAIDSTAASPPTSPDRWRVGMQGPGDDVRGRLDLRASLSPPTVSPVRSPGRMGLLPVVSPGRNTAVTDGSVSIDCVEVDPEPFHGLATVSPPPQDHDVPSPGSPVRSPRATALAVSPGQTWHDVAVPAAVGPLAGAVQHTSPAPDEKDDATPSPDARRTASPTP